MKGYKAFKKGWVCRDMQYEIGKSYEMEEEPIICERGYHFCANPIDVFGYYDISDNTVIAEVEAYGEIKQEGTKFCTNKIKIVKEFTRKQLQALILNGNYNAGKNNTGDNNSGDNNSGNRNSGIFNTDEPKMRAFNKEAEMPYTKFIRGIDYSFHSLCDRICRKTLVDGDWDKIEALPNYDAKIFYQITGLRKEKV